MEDPKQRLIAEAEYYKGLAEKNHIIEWSENAVQYYADCLNGLLSTYLMLITLFPDSRSELEDLRLNVKKEVLRQEKKLNALHDKLETTRGNTEKLVEEVFTEGRRHLRLLDQSEILSQALNH